MFDHEKLDREKAARAHHRDARTETLVRVVSTITKLIDWLLEKPSTSTSTSTSTTNARTAK